MKAPWDMVLAVVTAVLGSSAFWRWVDSRSGLRKEVKDIKDMLTSLKRKEEFDTADGWRSDILLFDAELRRHEMHSYEEYNEAIRKVSRYKKFCDENKTYPNTAAEAAIENIVSNYKEREKDRNYL